MIKLDVHEYKRLQIVAKDFFDMESDYYLSNIYEDKFTGSNRIKLLINLLVEEPDSGNSFWKTYAEASIASTKVNSVLSLEEIQELLKLTEDKYKKSKKSDDLDLFNNLSEFVLANRLLSEADRNIERSSGLPNNYSYYENPSQEMLTKIIDQGKDILFKSILVNYGIFTSEMVSLYKGNPFRSPAEKNVFAYLHKKGLIAGSDMADDLMDKANYDEEVEEMGEYDFFLARQLHHYYVRGQLSEFKNKFNYVRVSHGEFLNDFTQIWNTSNLDQGGFILEKINEAISYLQQSLSIRTAFSNFKDISTEELSILAGLQNQKTITNEISSGKTLLKKVSGNSDLLTYKSCYEWLGDSKRRKVNFYNTLKTPLDITIEDLREIYKAG
ncbi:hypothetical protein OAW20_02215 [Gammaproteobacteria bacterium]|nr:hypothetical protein [Gammaproteobacteria bacterium]